MRQNEQSWICTGGTLDRLWYGHLSHESEGHPGAVGFPYQWVMDREESKGDIVGFMHTHPGMMASPSLRDDATMHQWVMCFGKPLLCLIEGNNGLRGYLYFDDESDPIPCYTVKQFGQLVVCVLPPKKDYSHKPAVVLKPGTEKKVERKVVAITECPAFEDGLEDDELFDDVLCIDWDELQYGDQ